MNSQRVKIVHLRRANPTKNIFQLQAKVKLNCGRKVWGELCHYKTFLRVDWDFRRRVTRIIFLVNKYFSIRPFFSNLTLNSTTMQLSFTKDFKEKVLVSIIPFTAKDCVPHNKYAYSSDSSRRRIKLAHATNIQEIQPADIFFPANVN